MATPYTGVSIVDYLNSIGQPSDFASRAKLAQQKGIANYTGTADQNTQLLGILRTPLVPAIAPANPPQPGGVGPTGLNPDGTPVGTTPQGQTPLTPVPASAPASVAPPLAQPQDQTYIVQPGDNLSAIASRLGVPVSSITGYRSGNPNLIYPGETLRIGSGVSPTTQNRAVGQPGAPQGGSQEASPEMVKQVQDIAAQVENIKKQIESGAITPPTTDHTTGGNPNAPQEVSFIDQVKGLLNQYGITPPDPTKSPTTAFADTYKALYENLGLADIKTHYDSILKEYDNLNKELQDKILAVNENPWISEGQRSKSIAQLQTNYQARTDALTNKLKLYESMYDNGRQDAQFIAGKAIEISHQGQELNKDILFKAIDLAEKAAEAKRQAVNTSEIKNYEYAVKHSRYTGGFTDFLNLGRRPVLGTQATTIVDQLNATKGADGYVNTARYAELRRTSKIKPTEFDNRFSGMLNPNDPTAKEFISHGKRATASTIDQEALNAINQSITNGADLPWLYENYSGISPALIQSLYYNR